MEGDNVDRGEMGDWEMWWLERCVRAVFELGVVWVGEMR